MKNSTSNKPPKVLMEDFLWGAATSAYQIEGGFNADGKGLSIWDTFCKVPGNIIDGTSGEIACNHYELWDYDVEMISQMNLEAYRFSISWPRIYPSGKGKLNVKGLEFYDRLIDKLLSKNIEPFITLYHWDLPQKIQDFGGWTSGDTSDRFADYALTVFERFQGRVKYWTTLNEPYIAAIFGHLFGVHAPGLRNLQDTLKAVHHMLLGHGKALQRMREAQKSTVKLGIVLNYSPSHALYPDSKEDREAAKWYDIVHNRLFLDPLYKGYYPKEILEDEECGPFFNQVSPEDMKIISTPMDILGINYYTRSRVKSDPSNTLLRSFSPAQQENPYSDLWEYYPEGLGESLQRIWNDYKPSEIFITENGTSIPEIKHDEMRIEFIKGHIKEVSKAIHEGIKISGYFVWSLMDNFEWQSGYTKRFGLVSIDDKDLTRKPKDSAWWYANFIKYVSCHNG